MENPTEHLVAGLPLRAYLWLFLTVIVVPAVCEDPCDSGWFYVEFDGSARCYFLSSAKSSRSFSDSSGRCIDEGANLASLATESESQALITLFSSNQEDERFKRNDYWIGLQRSDEDQPWQWLDGTELVWLNWDTDEPQESETCARTVYDDNFQWRGIDCNREFGRICEKMPNVITTTQRMSSNMPPVNTTTTGTIFKSPSLKVSSSMAPLGKDGKLIESRTEGDGTREVLVAIIGAGWVCAAILGSILIYCIVLYVRDNRRAD